MSDEDDSPRNARAPRRDPMVRHAYNAFAAAWRDNINKEPWKKPYEKRKKYLLTVVPTSKRVAVEDMAEKISTRADGVCFAEALAMCQPGPQYAICAIHVAYDNLDFLQLMMKLCTLRLE
jgi:hypothetical protein